jgi:hypothetical protein
MKKQFHRWLTPACGLLLALLLCGIPVQARDPWGLQPQASEQKITHVIDVLGHASVASNGELDRELLALNFKPGISNRDWFSMPEREKLTLAYRWASAVSNENGLLLLARLSHRFAERYESLGFNPVFIQFHHQLQEKTGQKAADITSIPFRKPTAAQLHAALPADVERLIKRLAVYVDGPGPLGKYTLAAHVFNLEGEKLEQAMEKRDPVSFLKNASQQAPKPPPVSERLNLLIKKVMLHSEAASRDTALTHAAARLRQEFGIPPRTVAHADILLATQAAGMPGGIALPETTPHPFAKPSSEQSHLPLIDSGHMLGGGASPRIQEATITHQRFMNHFYSSPGSKTHASVMGRAGGGGGVIAGAAVTSSLGKPSQISLEILPNKICGKPGTEVKGSISVRTNKGVYHYRDISCDVMLAARNITYGIHDAQPWQSGEAIVLATIDTAGLYRTYPVYAPADENPLKLGRRHRMLLHPALIDLDIGRAMALLDLWPSVPHLIFRVTDDNKTVSQWLKARNAVTWKWSDSPSTITASGTSIRVTPVHRQTMLSLREFSAMDVLKENMLPAASDTLPEGIGHVSSAFDRAAPVLMRHIPDFSRAEELLTVLALFRWARQEGATLANDHIALHTPMPATPDTIITGFLGDTLSGASSSASWTAECETVRKHLDAMKKIPYPPDDRRRFAIERAEKIVARAESPPHIRCHF